MSWNVSLNKDTKAPFLGEAGNVEFRAEFFNVLNNVNYSKPNATVYSSGPTFTAEGVETAPA